ncbi:MAG: ATP-dependent acyl-CoA ligase [Solirubrobacterales bacterium]
MSDVLPRTTSPLRGLPLEQQTLPELLNLQAERFGEKALLRCGEFERSFSGVRDDARAAGAALEAAGIGAGDRVLLLSNNRVELLQTVLGCACIGALAVPVNVALRGAQLQHVFDNSRPSLIVAERELLHVLGDLDLPESVSGFWLLGEGEDQDPLGEVPRDPFPALDPSAVPAEREIGPETLLAILYTSGTTGPSKGVCCPHAQFYWWGVTVGEQLDLEQDDVLYTCLPMFHTNALNAFVQALVAGATFVIGERFSASRFWGRVAAQGATVTYLLGAMVNILYGREPSEEDRAHRLRVALAPATSVAIHAAFEERFGLILSEGYGSTETNGVIGAAPGKERPGWMGVVRPDYEIDVVDELDRPVPDGEPGELILRPRHPFSFASGYFAMDEATVKAWRNLWFHSGDRVIRDGEGWLRFVDRSKDAIRRRGENISSHEVEQAILTHDDIAAVAAFAVPSEMSEDEVMCAVVVKPGRRLEPVDVIRHCEGKLAYFAIPRYVDIVTEMPLTGNGKIRKSVLRERGIGESTWDREAAGYELRR